MKREDNALLAWLENQNSKSRSNSDFRHLGKLRPNRPSISVQFVVIVTLDRDMVVTMSLPYTTPLV